MPDINGQSAGGVQLNNTSPWTAAQTFPASGIKLTGTSTNLTTFTSLATTARTMTFPDATGTVAITDIDNAFSNLQTIVPTGLANTNADAVILGTLGAATAPATQFDSGSLRFTCSAWKSNATAGPQLNDFIIYALPVTGTAVSSTILQFASQNQVTGGGFFNAFGIVASTTGGGAVLAGNKAGSGALWLGSNSVAPNAIPAMAGNGATLTISSQSAAGPVNIQNNGTTVLAIQASGTLASATSLTWNGVFVPALTVTLSGSTAITTATGLNLVTITAPVFSTASTIAVTASSTVAITGPPTITGASSSITTPYTLWLQGGNFGQAGITSLYNNVATKGAGQPAIYGLDNRTGLVAADGSATTLYTTMGANQLYRISADIFATAAVTGTANYTITWTENSTTQTAVVSATAINVLGTSTQIIRPDNATAITAQLTGTFTGTFSVAGIVERLA